MIRRTLQTVIESRMFRGKAIILVGARQVGKSTLMRQVLEGRTESRLSLNCDEPEVREILSGANSQELRQLIGDNRIVFIDEAQRVPDIGLTLKLITDNMPEVQLLVTGSSAFELNSSLNEPLTGRKYEYELFPFSSGELLATRGPLYIRQSLESRLIYGSYPAVVNNADDARELLLGLSDSYLYKDLLSLEGVRKPELLGKLLAALSLQVGNDVSYNELAQTVGSDSKTVERYVGLLEKCFIVFRHDAFSRNLRNELKKGKKIYFYDNGIRNAVIQNFSPIQLRQDMGALWENFVVSERIKHNRYSGSYAKSYFWRTTGQQEIDYVEEADGQFTLLEMKWNPRRKNLSMPSAFAKAYPVKASAIVTQDNYLEWL